MRFPRTIQRIRISARRRSGRFGIILVWSQLILGLAVYGVAVTLMIRSELGLGPWDAFHVGLHLVSGISVGMASIVVGMVIVAGTYLIGVRPGPGTIANMILIGVFIDIFLPIIPVAPSFTTALGYFAAGILGSALATGMYIAAGLGKGPRDGLMLGISRRMEWRVGRVRTGIEVIVLVCGWLMGGTIGLGTIIFALTIGPATQWGLRVFGISATGTQSVSRRRTAPRVRRAA